MTHNRGMASRQEKFLNALLCAQKPAAIMVCINNVLQFADKQGCCRTPETAAVFNSQCEQQNNIVLQTNPKCTNTGPFHPLMWPCWSLA